MLLGITDSVATFRSSPDTFPGRYLGFKHKMCANINVPCSTGVRLDYSCCKPSITVISPLAWSTVVNGVWRSYLFTIVVHCVDDVKSNRRRASFFALRHSCFKICSFFIFLLCVQTSITCFLAFLIIIIVVILLYIGSFHFFGFVFCRDYC